MEKGEARLAIQRAYIALLEKGGRITATDIIRAAPCNRATFYYHYDDTNELLEKTVEDNIPINLTSSIFSALAAPGGLTSWPTTQIEEAVAKDRGRIENLSVLLSSSAGGVARSKFKQAIYELWRPVLGLGDDDFCGTTLIVLEFISNGIIGMVCAWGKHPDADQLRQVLRALEPMFPHAALESLKTARSLRSALAKG